jgi:predicted naringenin-chalcone synthase
MKEIESTATVLTDFHSVRLRDLVPQEKTCKLLAKGVVKALAVKSGKTSEKDVEKIHKKVRTKFSQFAVSEKTIKQRYLSIWPENYDAADEECPIVENGRFIEYESVFPMYENLAKNHTNPAGAGLNDRMELYRIHTEKHLRKLYNDAHEQPDHIIHVTSTGYFDPNPVDSIISEKKWPDVDITNFYHKACNAPIPAIRTANALIRSSVSGGYEKPKKRIDLVHSEMFSIHINLSEDHPINVGLMSTFSDSFLRYSIMTYDDARKKGLRSLKIVAFKNMTIPNSTNTAVWKVSDPAFEFRIDPMKYFRLVRMNIKNFVKSFFIDAGMEFRDVKDRLLFVFQASSSLILKQIAKELDLSEEQMAFSRNTLYENGYLSSGAIPVMCKQLIDDPTIPSGQKIICIGYAQGITISGMLLEKV